jgi:hypothetical protein
MKLIIWLPGILVVVGGLGLVVQRQYAANRLLTREQTELHARLNAAAQENEDLSKEVQRLSQPVAVAPGPSLMREDRFSELLRLRGEVTLLREQVRTQALAVAEAQRQLTATVMASSAARNQAAYLTDVTLARGELVPGQGLSGLIDVSVSMPPVVQANGRVQWHHDQAVGAPDTASAGDRPTAWAPRNPQSGTQWLALGYDQAVEIGEINIHESYHPGAISKVAAILPDGSERVIWEGTMAAGGDGLQVTSVPVPRGTTGNQIIVYVDTNRVQSWPEIDAVELVGTDGSRQWATSSSASSSYSETYGNRGQ